MPKITNNKNKFFRVLIGKGLIFAVIFFSLLFAFRKDASASLKAGAALSTATSVKNEVAAVAASVYASDIKNDAFIKIFNQKSKGAVKTVSKHYAIQAITTGRFLSKGIQTAVATRHRIILYNLSLNGKLAKIAQYNLSLRSNPIYLGSYIISKNNRALVLTKSQLGEIISYLLVYRNGKLLKLTRNYHVFLRAMRIGNSGMVLTGQEPISVVSSDNYFNNAVQINYPIGQFGGDTYIYKFDKNTDSLVKTQKLPLYNGVALYGTVYGNIKGNGKNYLLALSNSGNLMMINNKGKTVYSGLKTYGGSPLQVRVPHFGGVVSSNFTGSSQIGGLIYNIPAKVTGFYKNNKKIEVIVLKNYGQNGFMRSLNYYTKSSIYGLAWNSTDFYPLWKTKPVAGYSAGFSIFKSGGKAYLADAIVEAGSIFTKSKSYIIIFKLPL